MRTAIVSNLLNLKDILSHISINSLALDLPPGYLLGFLSELYIPPWLGKFFKFMLFRLLEMHFLLMPPDKTFPQVLIICHQTWANYLFPPKQHFFESLFSLSRNGERGNYAIHGFSVWYPKISKGIWCITWLSEGLLFFEKAIETK